MKTSTSSRRAASSWTSESVQILPRKSLGGISQSVAQRSGRTWNSILFKVLFNIISDYLVSMLDPTNSIRKSSSAVCKANLLKEECHWQSPRWLFTFSLGNLWRTPPIRMQQTAVAVSAGIPTCAGVGKNLWKGNCYALIFSPAREANIWTCVPPSACPKGGRRAQLPGPRTSCRSDPSPWNPGSNPHSWNQSGSLASPTPLPISEGMQIIGATTFVLAYSSLYLLHCQCRRLHW